MFSKKSRLKNAPTYKHVSRGYKALVSLGLAIGHWDKLACARVGITQVQGTRIFVFAFGGHRADATDNTDTGHRACARILARILVRFERRVSAGAVEQAFVVRAGIPVVAQIHLELARALLAEVTGRARVSVRTRQAVQVRIFASCNRIACVRGAHVTVVACTVRTNADAC